MIRAEAAMYLAEQGERDRLLQVVRENLHRRTRPECRNAVHELIATVRRLDQVLVRRH